MSDFTYATLPPLRRRDVPLPPPFHAPGALLDWHPAEAAPSASPSSFTEAEEALRSATVPPLLEEVFERFPSQCINIDLKHGNAELVDKVAALVQKHGRQHITIWGSGSDVVAQQSDHANSICTAARTRASGRGEQRACGVASSPVPRSHPYAFYFVLVRAGCTRATQTSLW